MNAGELRFRVTIKKPVRLESAKSGESIINFEPVRDVWAGIRPLTAREQSNYAGTQLIATHEIKMRYAPDIAGDCQLEYQGRTFHIVGPPINVGELNAELRLTVSEKPS